MGTLIVLEEGQHLNELPLTASQQLRRLYGYQPNDGAREVNFATGDRGAMEEKLPATRPVRRSET